MWSTLRLELLRAKNVVLTDERMFQCPHGLELLQFVQGGYDLKLMFQCPLGLIPHFYIETVCLEEADNGSVSMPSRAYTSFLRYPFKNLGFMRFPEPVFAGIYQNILTTAVFRAC